MELKLPSWSAENVLAVLCFDDKNAQLVRNAITPELFDGPHRVIAQKAIQFFDAYQQPIKDHLGDELSNYLAGEQSEKYKEIIISLYSSSQQHLNSKYIIDKLTAFLRDRKFENALEEAARLQFEGKWEQAKEVMQQGIAYQFTFFDPGIKLSDLALLSESLNQEDLLPTEVEVLNQMEVGPALAQVILLVGLYSCGKSWWQISLGKIAMKHGFKVAHITLEISDRIVQQRYLQTLCGLTRWQMGMIKTPVMVKNANNDLMGFEQTIITPRSLDEEEIVPHIRQILNKYGPIIDRNVRIKQFANGQLTMQMLRAYLDGLERTENFVPHLVIIDQPRNMKLDPKNFRLEIGQLYQDLRGLAVERNCALSATHHSNREGFKANQQSGQHISEDLSILNTVDTAIFYNQKPLEYKYKRARLSIDRSRSTRSQFTVLITQDYDIAQFSKDSILEPQDYKVDSVEDSPLME